MIEEGQALAGVGYSLGAIVLNNYVSSFGDRVALDVSVSISGALDCRYQQHYARSRRIWQSMIVAHMKDQFLYSKWGNRIYTMIGPERYRQLMRARDIVVSLSAGRNCGELLYSCHQGFDLDPSHMVHGF